ncbi:MAG: hypothetical protein ACPF95_05120, partial [Flavobacteriaceae bacterium]
VSNPNALESTYEDAYLKQQIALKSIVNVYAKPNHVPLKPNSSIAYMTLGKPKNSVFFQELQKHAKTVQEFPVNAAKSIRGKSIVVGVFADTSTPWKNTFLPQKDVALLHQFSNYNTIYVVGFAKPYALQQFPNLSVFSNVLWAHENQPEFAKAAAKILFGKHKAVGVFPIETAQ